MNQGSRSYGVAGLWFVWRDHFVELTKMVRHKKRSPAVKAGLASVSGTMAREPRRD